MPYHKIRIARPTDNLKTIVEQYSKGLGFIILASFEDHESFDGYILGEEKSPYHVEFTHHNGAKVGKAPTKDNLLVFYYPDKNDYENRCTKMFEAGFLLVPSYNSYWDVLGKTFEDVDGYRVVIYNSDWTK